MNPSTRDRLQNMALRISQHCTPCIRNWLLFHDLDHEFFDSRQSNTFARHPSFPTLMEGAVLSCREASQFIVCLDGLIFERRILPQVHELRLVESQKEQFFSMWEPKVRQYSKKLVHSGWVWKLGNSVSHGDALSQYHKLLFSSGLIFQIVHHYPNQN